MRCQICARSLCVRVSHEKEYSKKTRDKSIGLLATNFPDIAWMRGVALGWPMYGVYGVPLPARMCTTFGSSSLSRGRPTFAIGWGYCRPGVNRRATTPMDQLRAWCTTIWQDEPDREWRLACSAASLCLIPKVTLCEHEGVVSRLEDDGIKSQGIRIYEPDGEKYAIVRDPDNIQLQL